MSDFNFPIEKAGVRHSFVASNIRTRGEHGEKLKLGQKEKPDKVKSFWDKRSGPAPSSSKQVQNNTAEKIDKNKENLSIIKLAATAVNKKSLEKEEKRLKFYKVKFFKK